MRWPTLFAIPALALLAACAQPAPEAAPETFHAERHYALGLKYMDEGRYLLAREHFALALATAGSEDLRRRSELELSIAERAARTLR